MHKFNNIKKLNKYKKSGFYKNFLFKIKIMPLLYEYAWPIELMYVIK